jgi:hypothetical protein
MIGLPRRRPPGIHEQLMRYKESEEMRLGQEQLVKWMISRPTTLSMASNTAFGVVKEFIPDIRRSLAKHH